MVKFRKMLVNDKGFTLVELLVVIAVLGILAAIAIPRLTGVTDKARLAEAKTSVGSLKNAVEMVYAEAGTYASANTGSLTTSNIVYDYIDPGTLSNKFSYSINAGQDTYTITASGSTGLSYSIDNDGNTTETLP